MGKNKGTLLLIVMISLILGYFIGGFLSEYVAIFGKTFTLSIMSNGAPIVIDLQFITLAFGLEMKINLGSILFLMIGLIAYFRN